MRVNDSVMKMAGGSAAWLRDRTQDEGYGTSALRTGLSYDPNTIIGIQGGNLNLPVLELSDGYYSFPGEVSSTCFKGKQCMGTTSRRYAATFYDKWGFDSPGDMLGLFQSSNNALGAWNLKDLMLQRGTGDVVWERSGSGAFSSSEELGDLASTLQVGDMITFTRTDGTMKSMEDHPGFEEEAGVTHVGMVVGQTADGTPIVEHSWANKSNQHFTRRESLDTIKGYIPSSILRPNFGDRPADVKNPRMVSRRPLGTITPRTNQAISPAEAAAPTGNESVNVPGNFGSLQELDDFLRNDLPMETAVRLKRMGVYEGANEDVNIFHVPEDQAMSLLDNYLSQNASEDDMVDVDHKAQRKENREEKKASRQRRREAKKMARFDGVEHDVPSNRLGGLIYKKI